MCLKQIREGTVENSITVLQQALEYGEQQITKKCLEIIDKNCDELIRSHGIFQDICLKCMC